jgi:hypothetical protein
MYSGHDVRDQIAGIDSLVDEMERAADFFRLPVVQSPEGAVGPAVLR